ncbi:hypothetical protein WA026_016007 [Henosepilachna vigintioctopunctata]
MNILGSKKHKCNFMLCGFITSLVFIISGIIIVSMRYVLHNKLRSEAFILAPGTKSFEMLKKSPFNTYFDIYFFNWTNPKDFHDSSKKPKFKEVGPFRFLEVYEKTNISFHENSTVSYNRTRRWYFVEEESAYDLYEPITTINPVSVSAAYVVRNDGFIKRKGLSFSMNSIHGKMDMTQSAGNLLFLGYDDAMMSLAKKLPFIKDLPPMDKFGWFYGRNGSNTFDGRFNVYTGNSSTVTGKIHDWNNLVHSPFYEDKCGDIRGSAGEFFPHNLRKETLDIFNIEMCRTIVLDFDKEVREGLFNAYRYTAGDHFLDNGTIIPENKCYCTGDCVPYGMVNVSSCRYGSPGFVSLPHFYKADPYYGNLVEGLNPSERHNFYMTLEPNTGLPLEVAARLQLNLLVKKVPSISLLEDINELFFPMVWFEQVVKIPSSLSLGLFILLWIKEICLALGFSMIFMGLFTISYIIYRICTTPLCGGGKNRPYMIKELVPLNQEKLG